METVENDANVKIEVPWEDDVLCNEIVANDFDNVKVKLEPVNNSVGDGENQDPKHEIIDIKDEFGQAWKDFDLSNARSNSDSSESDALLIGNLFKKKEKNPNSIYFSHEIIDIKDEFGHAMKDFEKVYKVAESENQVRDKAAESEKWNYDSMHAHFLSRIHKICKLSSAESLTVANAMIKACKEAFPCLNSDLRAHYLSAKVELEERKENNNNAQEPWLLDLRQFIHSQLSEKVQEKQAKLYSFCEIVDLIVSYFSGK